MSADDVLREFGLGEVEEVLSDSVKAMASRIAADAAELARVRIALSGVVAGYDAYSTHPTDWDDVLSNAIDDARRALALPEPEQTSE